MTRRRFIPLAVLPLLAAATVAPADVILRRDAVVPVVFNDEITLRSRVGDAFTARVDDSRDLPYGTRLAGEVVRIERAQDGRPAYADLEFTELILPNGRRTRIEALPVALDGNGVRRGRDGRFEVVRRDNDRTRDVLTGAAGGLIIGSLIRKQLEGAILGTVAGIVYTETKRRGGSDVFIRRGQRMGAAFDREVRVDVDGFDWQDDFRRVDEREYRRERPDGGRDIDVRLNGETLRTSGRDRVYRDGEVVMVPLERAVRALGLRFERVGERLFVEDDQSLLRLETNARTYRLNGRRGSLSRAVTDRNGTLFVPIDALTLLRPDSVEVDGNRLRRTDLDD